MTSSPPEVPATPPETPSATAHFEFIGFAVNKVAFEHMPRVRPDEGEVLPPNLNLNLTLGAGVRVFQGRRAEVSVGMTVMPDPKWQPYKIEIEVLGHFQTPDGTEDDLRRFCQRGVPTLLYPYIREIVHRLTVDGRYGVVRLNPLNVQSLLSQTEWQTVQPDLPITPPPTP